MKKVFVVSGEGKAETEPDLARIVLGVLTVSPDARTETRENAALLRPVIDAVKIMCIADRHIQTSSLSLYPVREQHKDNDGETWTNKIVGYQAMNSVTVMVEDPSRAGDVIDAGVAAGANANVGISFGLKDESALQHLALERAFEAARAKARTLATAMHVKPTSALLVNESRTSPMASFRQRWPVVSSRSIGSTPVEVGTIDVTANVTVLFRFRR